MGRFDNDYDYDDEYAALNYGRWQRNMRAALKGKRGRAALRALREALMALPEHRLITSAACTVGGVDKRAPAMTDAEFDAYAAELAQQQADAGGLPSDPDWPRRAAGYERAGRQEERDDLAGIITGNGGEGVCAVAAFAWHRKVKAGMDPAEAFDSLPTIFGADGEDAATATAELGQNAGLTYTLAWMLGDRNDETYRRMTPEERWQAFIDWIDAELAESTTAA